MNILESLRNEIKTSMFSKNEMRTKVLRMLLSAVKNFEVEKMNPVDGDEFDAIVKKQIKERIEAIEDFKRGGRPELAKEEEDEIAILKEFARAELSDDEIEKILDEKIKELGLTSSKEIGRLMGAAMKELKGKASGTRIKDIAQKLLGSE